MFAALYHIGGGVREGFDRGYRLVDLVSDGASDLGQDRASRLCLDPFLLFGDQVKMVQPTPALENNSSQISQSEITINQTIEVTLLVWRPG